MRNNKTLYFNKNQFFFLDEDLLQPPDLQHTSSSVKKPSDLRKKTLLNDMSNMKIKDKDKEFYLVCKSNSRYLI